MKPSRRGHGTYIESNSQVTISWIRSADCNCSCRTRWTRSRYWLLGSASVHLTTQGSMSNCYGTKKIYAKKHYYFRKIYIYGSESLFSTEIIFLMSSIHLSHMTRLTSANFIFKSDTSASLLISIMPIKTLPEQVEFSALLTYHIEM